MTEEAHKSGDCDFLDMETQDKNRSNVNFCRVFGAIKVSKLNVETIDKMIVVPSAYDFKPAIF